jgi:hypothetical protein
MAQQETGLSKLIARETEQQRVEKIRNDERKAHARRTTEMLKDRFGVPDDDE